MRHPPDPRRWQRLYGANSCNVPWYHSHLHLRRCQSIIYNSAVYVCETTINYTVSKHPEPTPCHSFEYTQSGAGFNCKTPAMLSIISYLIRLLAKYRSTPPTRRPTNASNQPVTTRTQLQLLPPNRKFSKASLTLQPWKAWSKGKPIHKLYVSWPSTRLCVIIREAKLLIYHAPYTQG